MLRQPVLRSRSEPVLFGRSRCEGPAQAPGSGFTFDETDEILNDYSSFVLKI